MYVCLCKGVSSRVIRRVVEEGARSADEVGRRCGAGTVCGACRSDVADLVRMCRVQASAPSGEEVLAAK